MVLYDMTDSWFEGKYENSELISFGRAKMVRLAMSRLLLAY